MGVTAPRCALRAHLLPTVMSLGVVLALAACVGPTESGAGGATPKPPSSASPSVSASEGAPSPSESPVPSGSPAAPEGQSVPVIVPCDVLVDASTLYELNPNLAFDSESQPTALGARAVADQGISCGWIHETAGTRLTVAVAAYNGAGLDAARGAAATRGGVATDSTVGTPGYFREAGGVGTVELFRGQYWIIVESPIFGSSTEAQTVINAVVRALP